MSKQVFMQYVKTEGVYNASLYAAMNKVSLAQVQLWIKGI